MHENGHVGRGLRVYASPLRNGNGKRFACLAAVLGLLAVTTLTAQRRAATGLPVSLPAVPYAYADARPDLLPHGAVDPRAGGAAEARRHDHLVTLGRVLFYDRRLSDNGRRSCASCHRQEHAFGDRRAKSRGLHGRATRRNTSSLVNLAYHPGPFFWDGRAETLEEAVLLPIQDPVEMGAELADVVARLAAEPGYATLFAAAFGTAAVDEHRLAAALAAFVRAIVSHGSRYDAGLAAANGDVGVPFDGFTARENRGKVLYFGEQGARQRGCAACHNRRECVGFCGNAWHPEPSVFTSQVLRNNGVDGGARRDDAGLGAITGERDEVGLFRAPSLRNVAHSGPYMHDGRVRSLDDVLRFYGTACATTRTSTRCCAATALAGPVAVTTRHGRPLRSARSSRCPDPRAWCRRRGCRCRVRSARTCSRSCTR